MSHNEFNWGRSMGAYFIPRTYQTGSIFQKRCLPEGYTVKFFNSQVALFRQVTSTNLVAKQLGNDGAPAGTVVWSQYQSAGRGRLKRHWDSPPDRGLLFSILIRPKINIQKIPLLTLLTAAVTAEAVNRLSNLSVGIKWPNDILINGKKLCGILAESSFYRNEADYVVIGIGINVNHERSDFPAEVQPTATSLRLELGYVGSRVRYLQEFIRVWNMHYNQFLHKGEDYVREIWIKHNITLGREVTVLNGEQSIQGKATGISSYGALLIETPGGKIYECMADDISLGKEYYR